MGTHQKIHDQAVTLLTVYIYRIINEHGEIQQTYKKSFLYKYKEGTKV